MKPFQGLDPGSTPGRCSSNCFQNGRTPLLKITTGAVKRIYIVSLSQIINVRGSREDSRNGCRHLFRTLRQYESVLCVLRTRRYLGVRSGVSLCRKSSMFCDAKLRLQLAEFVCCHHHYGGIKNRH